jgi:hypothetical protein
MQYGALTFSLYPQRRADNVDVFVAVTDDKDWLIPSLTVHFITGKVNNKCVVKTLDLPEFNSTSGSNLFDKVEPNSDGHYTCQNNPTNTESITVVKPTETVVVTQSIATIRHCGQCYMVILLASLFHIHLSLS